MSQTTSVSKGGVSPLPTTDSYQTMRYRQVMHTDGAFCQSQLHFFLMDFSKNGKLPPLPVSSGTSTITWRLLDIRPSFGGYCTSQAEIEHSSLNIHAGHFHMDAVAKAVSPPGSLALQSVASFIEPIVVIHQR